MTNTIALQFKNWTVTDETKQMIANEIATLYIEDLDYSNLKEYIESNFGTDLESMKAFKEDVKWFMQDYENEYYKNNDIDLDFYNNEFTYAMVKKEMAKLFMEVTK